MNRLRLIEITLGCLLQKAPCDPGATCEYDDLLVRIPYSQNNLDSAHSPDTAPFTTAGFDTRQHQNLIRHAVLFAPQSSGELGGSQP